MSRATALAGQLEFLIFTLSLFFKPIAEVFIGGCEIEVISQMPVFSVFFGEVGIARAGITSLFARIFEFLAVPLFALLICNGMARRTDALEVREAFLLKTLVSEVMDLQSCGGRAAPLASAVCAPSNGRCDLFPFGGPDITAVGLFEFGSAVDETALTLFPIFWK